MKQNQNQLEKLMAMQKQMPSAIKVDELILVCSNNVTDFNNKCNACLDEKREGGPMSTFEPLGMVTLEKNKHRDMWLWQIFVREEAGATLEPEDILPEKVRAIHFVKSEDTDSFNAELKLCIDNGFLLADVVRVNPYPDTSQLIFTAMFIKTDKQLIKTYSTIN